MTHRARVALMLALAAIIALAFATPALAAEKGFDQFGYNYTARIFSGPADGVDRVLDGAAYGDAKYGNDLLVMKWSKAWDDARFNGAPWTAEAWCTNHWNGNVPGGSGESDECKIIWVGPALELSPLWREGGSPIWGEFEVIYDKYMYADGSKSVLAHAAPAGLGQGLK